ncbi:enhanced entry virulence factor RtxA [Legionella pneumophila]|uniref:enhanced entry virulence factor RtxA n=6 Tax=Legionella pneumophila TaxID=446 RepID=UPI00090BFC57|nr:Leukotoxin [Legionella pneumophila]
MLVESVIGIVRAVNGLLEKVNAQGQASLVKSGARLQEGDVLTLLSGEAYIQFIHGFPEALALGKPVNLYGVSPALQYGVEELNEQLVQEALAKGIDPSVILDVLGSAAAGAEAVGSGGDAFIIDPLFGFGQVTAGYPTGPIAFGYEADTQHLFWYVPEETGAIAESELTTEPESIPQIPQFNSNQATVIVFEDALTGGIQDSAGQVTTARASLSPLISSSSEVASSFAFNTNLSALPTLKSGGIELDYILSSDRLALTASMPDGTNVARFELTADGQLTQILIGAIDHPTSDSDDNEWMRFDLSPVIDVTFTRTSDGTVLESRTLPDNAVVAGIQDDVPIARAQLTNNEILLDETVGVKVGDADAANDDFNPTTTADPFNNAYGIPTGLVQNANLLDTSTSEMGGDYKNATMTHLLKITDAVSGLQTTNGTPINLFLESNGDITGRAGDIGAPALFAIRMNPNTGAISVAQYGPIKQFDTNSHDEAVDLTGRISAVVTAKDSDGDVSNVEIPIGQLIIFEDDGPSIVVSGATQTLTVDESVLTTNDTQSFAGLFTPSFGADGAAAANALSYSLGVSANGAASGVLDTASGNQVFLFLENGIVVGREGSDALDAATGDVVFNISVDGSGNVTLDQVRAVVHDNPLDSDESTGPTQLSAANLVTLTAIATDKDGDSASATANIGLSFNFEDDGPSIVVSGATQTLTVDESVLATNDTQSFAGLFTPSFGADGAAAANALSYSLGVSANGAASGVLDTASGNQVFLFLENGIVVGREGSDALDAATGDVVFNISVDGSGNVTLDQVRAVVHDNPLDPDESTGPTQLSAANLVTLTAIATDKDGDSASATANIGLSFNFEDDGPSIVVSGATQTLTVDESVLATNDTQSFAGLFTPSFGADGAAAANALSYSLGVSANGAASGVLDTASGNQVFLFLENGIVVGREGSDALDAATGDVVFNISVDGSGNVTLDQVRAVVHDNPLDPDESTGPTQLSAANLVTLTAIATDKDGDSASATANIGLSFNFEDDGPSIVVSGATQTLTVDESVLATNDTQSFAGLFTPSFGADGAAAANALSYSLGVSANGAASGVLDTASGNQVFLFLENGIVVGREGSDALDAATGDVVFNISVDGSGNVTLDQVRAVVHDNPLDPDESTGPTQLSAANLVTLTAIATDKDGDSASATANIGLSFNFEDDGPSIVVSGATQTLTVDESVLTTNDTQSFAGLFTPSFGADGAAAANALSYSLGVSANGAASGVLDTASGNQVFLFLENGIVVGREGSDALDAATGDVVFNISVDGSGNVTLDQVRAVVHDNPLDPDESTGPTQLSAANLVTLTAIATDKDGDSASATANIGLSFNFEDDGPSIVVSGATQTLTVDESVLTTNDTQSFAGLFTPSFGADGAAAANALSYSLGVSANGAASGVLDTASGNQVFLFLENGIVVGREGSDALDAATGDVVFNISVDGSGNVTLDQVRAVVHDNPLDPDESTGPTQLSAANLVTLTAIATDKDGDSASATANIGLSFNFEDDGPSIVVSGATQTLTVDESVLTTNDTQSFAGLFTPSFGADGAAAANALSYSLGVSANGAASGVLDTASGNQVFLFLENGIVVGREGSDALDAATGDVVFNISVDGSGNVTLDQVRAVVHDNPLDPDESTGPTQLSAANLVTLTAIATDKDGDSASATANIGLSFNFEDDGPSIVVSGATQTLTVDESVLTTNDTQSFAGLFTPSFGADGAAAANALSYSLGVSANGAASGVLDTASGNQVFLFLENGIVVGREGSDALDAATGDVVFNISVDGSGNVTLDQVRAVVHDNPLDPDESTGPTQLSAANLVTLTAIATDKDGDSASATANIGLSFNFEDDGPSIVVSGATQTLTVDESVLATNDTQSFAGLFTPSFGADGAAAANALSYSLGVSANGAASGVLDTASGNQVFLFLENGIVVGREGSDALDAATGDVVFNISVDGSGNVTLDQVRAVVHDNPLDPDESTGPTQLSAANLVTLTAIATDKDGDSASATANIGLSFNFEDDGPSIVVSGATQTLTVDESVLTTNDTQSFAGLFTPSFGADGAAAANALSYSLGVSANGAASGVLDTASGNQVFLFLENGIVVGREGSDALDAATGDVVFNISVDGSGNVTLDQVRAVVHDNPLDPDESTGPTQLSAANLVTLTAIATDKDGDSASATANIGLSFNFEDDGPSIVVSGATQTLTVDESVLTTNDTQSFAGLFTPSFGADGAAAANALSYSLGVSANGAASGVLDTASGNQVFLFLENGIVVGREGSDALDAATGDVVFNISVDGSGNVTLDQVRAVVHDNPLDPDESTGPTQLSAANLVTLTAIATDKDGDSASATANIGLSFNFEDDGPSIVVSGATQTLTVDESVLTTNDTQSFAGLFTPSFGADGAAAANALSYSLGVSANGAASGVLDTASGNQVFLFLENGIVVGREGSDALDAATGDVVFNISVDGSGNVTLDQVRAVVHDNPLDPDESTGPTQLSAANLVTLTAIATDKDGDSASATANIGLSFNFEDDGPSIVVSGATQTLTVDESVLTTNDTQSFAGLFTPSFGADGAAAANALSYSLGVSANGAASGVLDTASGNQVFLFLENGIVVGREGSDALDAATGDVVFNISVDGSGNVTLDQVRAVVHDNPLDPDESTGPTQLSAANLVTLTAIATDKDGDSASATANIGLSFNFEDDGPSIVVSGATQTLTVDESVLTTNDTQSFAGLFTPSFGADGAAAANALSYSLGVSANGAASGVLDTASGNQVFLFLENGIVVGREGSDALDAATGDVVFNISVDGSGNVTLDQVRAVVHDNPLDPDESTGPTQLSAANLVTLTAIATDKDGDSASATANIGLSFNFEDDGPSIVVSGATQTLTVDESVLATNDTQSFAGLFTPSFGADGAAAANALSYSLGVSANGAASGVLDTASGNQVFLFLENGIVVGREGSDALDAATGDVVFNISVDGSGNVTLDQVRAVVHDNPLNPDESTGPTQLSAANLVTLTAIATDKDGDSASATANIGLSFNFEDDGPSIVVSGATQTLTVDESVLTTNDTQSFAGLFTPSFGADGAASANALSYSLGVSANGAASGVLDTASGNQVFLFLENGIVVGREGSDALDAATGDVVFNISVDGSGNVTLDQVRAVVHDNPLDPDESTGPTQLSAANLVTLTAIATDKDGDSASATANIGLSFNFEDDGPSIVVSGATQTLTVDESVLTTNDTQSFAGLFTPSFGADGAAAANALSYSLGVSANGATSGVLDTASGNQVFLFLENGIVVGREGSDALDAATGDVVFNISVDGSGNVTLDQVRAVVHDNPLDPDESTGPTQLSAANLVTLTAIATDKDGDSASATANIGLSFNFEDDGPSIVVSGATQTLTVDESVLATNDTQSFAGLFTPSFGADGAAAANALSYSLGVSANGAASGVLDTASGNQVFLFLENGIVVGREGSDALDAATGDVVFNISVDGSGNVTLDQVRAVVHDNPLDPDESTGPTQLSAANLVTLTAIATDKDGDSASATANIGLSFNFEDDGPSIVVSGATQTLTVDESVLTTNDTQSFAGLFTPSFGADGAAAANALSYSLGVSANGAASGVLDTASGNQVFLFLENGIVVGREGSDALDAATGDVVFNISVDGSGNVTLDQVRAVVHDNPLDPDESTGPTQLSAANLVTLTAIATDKDGDSASATANIGLSFNFEDDGPSIVVSGATQTLTVDESVLATNDTQSFAGLFTPSFGADGAAAANALSYSLGVSANGAASGVLDTASGNQVFLFLENGIVVGREGSDALDAATGDVVFNISVDGSGNVTLDQVRAVVHDNPLDPDESTGPTQLSAANLVTLTAIATDKDGDSASATANIGLSFNFEDDGPSIVVSGATQTLTVDESVLTTNDTQSFAGLFTPSFGADGAAAANALSYSLGVSANGAASGVLDTASGNQVFLFLENGIVVGREGSDALDAATGDVVFNISVDGSGNVTLDQVRAVVHDNPLDPDESTGPTQLSAANLVTLTAIATDKDGDSASATANIGLSFNFEDDGPSIVVSGATQTLTVDESVLTTNDTQSFAGLFTPSFGADGAAAANALSYSLGVSANGAASGVLDTASGNQVFLFLENGIVVGREGSDALDAATGDVVFNISVDGSGNVTLDQVRAVVHDNPLDPDESTGPTQLSAANLVTLTAIATDKDGDSASATANIGLSFNFEDDGPSIVVSGATQTLTVDESVLATNDTQSFAGLFTPSFGADGAAAANALSYSLGVSANGAASGVLDTASGNQVFLFLENGIVVGREGSDALDAATGDVVFNISVDGSGNVTLDQVRAVVHDNPLDPDESTGPTQLSAANLVTLTAIATDKDGDSASATANIGLSFNFEDDGPSIVVSGATQTLTVDESVLTTNDTQSFAGLFTPSFGADGAAAANALSYSLGVSANGAASGVLDTASGNQVFLFLENGIVVGREGSDALDAATGDVVFNISVDGSGNVTLDQVRAVVHDNPLDPDESTGPTQLSAANLVTLTAIATDKDGDSASATANIGLSFNFEDDGPSIVVSGATQTLTVDESVLATNDTQSFAGLFTPSFGADGAAAANALSYSLGVSANGAASGVLDTASGNQVFLFLENGIVVGREGSDALDAATGDVVFNISVDGSGNVTLDQVRAVVHDNPLDPDESTGPTQLSAANLVTLTAIATDKDGDSASATANIGLSFNFEDDGPSIVVSGATQTLTVDESVLATNDTQSFAGLFTPSFGADGAAAANALSYSLGVSANGAASGVLDTASGNQVFLFLENGIVVGREGSDALDAATGDVVFNISVDGSGNVTLDQVRAVVHDNPLDPDESTGPTQLSAANLVTLTAIATDKDGDSASATANIGLSFNFEDDGPSIVVSGATQTLTVDESVLATNDTQSFAGLFTPSFGADGAAAANALSYSLGVSANGAASGVLDTASGNQVFLFLENGIVVGREGSDALDAATGDVVFNISVDGSGNVTLDQVRAVVHDNPLDPDESTGPTQLSAANLVTLTAIATDKDGDSASATANIGLSFNFEDDGPVASTNKLTGVVDEDGLTGGIAGGVGDVAGQAVAASGNVATLFQSGADAPLTYSLNASTSGLPALSSGGVALTYAVSGNTLTASAGSTQVFTFTLNANGNYSFTLLAKLDHPAGADENDITINLGSVIRATDSDGDTVTAAADGLVITVDDDTPIASANKLTGVVDEDGLTGGIAGGVGDVAGQAVAASGNVATLFQSGADAPLTYSLNASTSGLPALSSGGVALTYAVSGNTLTASAGSTQVFTFTLNANGNYSFTLLAKLDHPAGADENDITINLGSVIRATDSDGDTVTAAADGLVITVDDDTPIASANKLTGVVDEDGLTGGIAGGVGDVAGQAVAASGNVATLFQSGADAPLTYSLNANTSGLPALSSGGVALTYAVSGNTLTASAGSTQVFTFTLNANGNYSFTLLAKLDHPAGADENDITINLGSVIRATDSDGDTVTAAADGLVITVDDDTPIASANKLTGVVDEDGLTGGIAGGVGDVAGQAVAASGNVATLFQSGADAPLTYSLNASTSGLPALSSGGVALTYAVSGNTLTASAGSTQVFTFTLNANGNYSFTLLAKLDHPAGADENDITINLGSVIRATDSDGDTVTAAADGLVITVDDDTPIASANKLTGVVDEDGLTGGIAGGVGDVAGQAVAASGNVATLFQSGADAPLTYSLNANTSGLPALSSGGVALTYAVSGNTLTASAGSTQVFTFTLNANGNYSFTLLAKLDHPAGADENDITINLGSVIRATDSDGDTVTAAADGLVITVDDDTPIASANKLTGVVDEDGLTGGIAGGVGDVAGQAVAASGNVATLFQSGADAPLTYSLNANTSGLPALSSGGVALTYAVSGNTLTASAGSTQVFTFTLNANGNYSFTLLAKLDHPAGADENDITINLGSVIRATDSDGDTVTAAADGLVITVDDDTPIASANKLTGVVDEDGLTGGIAGGVGDVAGQAVAASGNVATLFQSGADAPLTYSLNANTSGLPALSSGGVALTYAVSGNTLTASAGSTQVFTFTLNANGNYSFTLLAKLDHPAGADENDITINLGSVIRATDSDGDTVTAAADGLVITVDDDTPVAITPEEGFVSNKAGVVKVFNLDLDSNIGNNVGADQPGSIRFINVVDGQQAQGIIDGELVNLTTVNGQLIKLYISNDGMIITGSTATSEAAVNSGNTVFKVTMLPDNDYNLANDKYSVEMFGKIGVINTVNFSDLAGDSPAGNVGFKIISDQDFPGYEVLITPKDRVNPDDTVGGTVNSSSTDISISNQWIEQGSGDSEILRLDYGQFAIVNNKFNIEKHFIVNGASFEIHQIQGGPSNRASINVKAFDADDDNQLNDDPLDAITRIVIFTSSGGVETVIADVTSDTSFGGMTFDFQGINGVNITGLDDGYRVRAYTADGYNRLEIDNISSTPFSIGGLGIQAIIDTEKEVKMTYDVRLTDSDGDSVDSSFDVNIAPSLLKVGENINDTSSSTVPHTVGNDVGVIDGGRGADVLVGDVGGVKDVRIAFVLDESGSMSQNFGGSTRMDVLKQVMTDVLTELGNTPNANITVHLVKFASIVNGTGTFNITGGELQNALDFISGLQIQQGNLAGTNYEAALGQTALWFNSLTGAADVQQTLFLTDGAPTLYMDGNSTDYTNINAVYGHGNQTEEVLWENLFGEHAGNQATVDLFNYLNESNSRDLDGTQSYSVDTDGDGDFETVSVNARSSGTTQSTSDLVRSTADNVNEVQALQAHGTLRAVSIANNVSVYLQDIDSTGQPYVASSPGLLQDILNELNPFNSLNPVGSDIIQGNEADDLIFGDTLFTDKLAEDEGLNLRKGSGWDVFEELEASHGWSRQDTLNYIASHADELGKETVLSNGSTRSGGHDTISGGQGNDRIYGQEGNDIIDGGAGNDVIVGGTGNDTLTGGSGADQFVFFRGHGSNNAGTAPTDIITDFEVNIDKIVINANNIIGVSVSNPVSNPDLSKTYTITVNYSDAPSIEHFKVTLSNGALLNDSGKTHLNGVVISGGTATIDGTIVGAVLYLDLNANNQEDEGERLGITNQYGHVEWVVDLSKFDVNGDGQYVIGEARAVQTGGFDIDTGLSYEINLYGPVGSAVISPLTSLLQAQLEAGMDYETANAALVARLGLPEGTQIISFNPITGSGEVLAQNAGVMTAAIQFAEIAAIHYSTDERHVSFAVFEAISKALLELPEGVVADFGDEGFLQSISNYLGLDALVTSEMIDYMATSQKALEASILTLAPGEDALTAISKIQHVTQGIYAQAIEMALIGYLPLDALKNMSAVLKAYADGDITDEQLNSFEDKLSAVIVNWEDNNVTDTSHQATLQTERTVDDSSVKSEANHEMAQEVNAVINDFMDEHDISLYYYDQQAQMTQETQEEQQPVEAQAEETVIHDDVVQDLLLDDHSLTMLANNPELNGGNGNDVLHGTTGNDFIRGGQGNDTMTGGGGVDTFFWLSGDDDGGVDTITDFKANPVDQSSDASVLNLSDLLSDADLETNSLDNYLNVSTTEEGDTAIKVDPNGNGNFDAPAQTIILEDVDLTAVFATNNSHDIVNQMIANGNLIVEQ